MRNRQKKTSLIVLLSLLSCFIIVKENFLNFIFNKNNSFVCLPLEKDNSKADITTDDEYKKIDFNVRRIIV